MNKTIKELLDFGIAKLQTYNIADATIDARLFLTHILKCDRTKLLLSPDEIVSTNTKDTYLAFIDRRAKGEPLQYILNEQEFMGLTFFVDNRVLIPRQDTELLIESIIEMSKIKTINTAIEIGVGSGCISISLAYFLKNISITAVDISQDAIDVATINAHAHKCNINFVKSDIFTNVAKNKVDLVISNPPYIPLDETFELMQEVKEFEPRIALTDEEDGLKFYRAIAHQAKNFLTDDGILAFEIGYNQGSKVKEILNLEGYKNIILQQDYNHKDRVIIANK